MKKEKITKKQFVVWIFSLSDSNERKRSEDLSNEVTGMFRYKGSDCLDEIKP